MKKVVVLLASLTVCVLFAATPTVTDVTAKQRYPWNGLVDITCNVTGISGTTNELEFAVAAVMPNSGDVRKVSKFWVVQNGIKSTDREVHTNGNYRLLWDASSDLGQVAYDNMVLRVTTVKGHLKVQLWEGGPHWADTNIGAENPEDYGYYFWWGDTVGYKRENNKWVATDGSSSNFSFSSGNATYYKTIATLMSEGWITADRVLVPEHDAAHVHWGGDWRMPTKQELADLVSKCDWTWTKKNGVNGHVVRGRDAYASNSIFLPAAGYAYETSLNNSGSGGAYWSSVPYSGSFYSMFLYFSSGKHRTDYSNYYRYHGQSVRPVQGFTN